MAHDKSTLAELATQKAEAIAHLYFQDEHDILDTVSVAWELAQSGEGTPNSIASYAVRRVRSRRQFRQCVRSVDSPQGWMRRGKLRGVGFTQGFNLDQIAKIDENPALIVQFRLDFEAWFAELPKRLRVIAELLANGETTGEVAARLGVTPAAVSQTRRRLENSWQAWLSDERD